MACMGRNCFLSNERLFHVVVVSNLDGRGGQEEEGEGEGLGEEGLDEKERGTDGEVRGHRDEYLSSNNNNKRIIA